MRLLSTTSNRRRRRSKRERRSFSKVSIPIILGKIFFKKKSHGEKNTKLQHLLRQFHHPRKPRIADSYESALSPTKRSGWSRKHPDFLCCFKTHDFFHKIAVQKPIMSKAKRGPFHGSSIRAIKAEITKTKIKNPLAIFFFW